MRSPDQIVTVDIDTTKFQAAIEAVANALVGDGKDVQNLLVDEHRRLTRTIVNFTAPTPASGARQIGELAVKKDLYSLISEAKPELINQIEAKYGLQNIDTYTASPGGKVHVMWDNLSPSGSNLAELHNRYRSPATGRPQRRKSVTGEWRSRIVVGKGMREPYVKLVQSHVGRWKAKWAFAAAQLGDKYPAWISRHFSHVANKAHFAVNLGSKNVSAIAFGGRGPNFARDKAKIKGALDFRIKTMMKRVALIVSGYNKQQAAGMRASAQAHKTSSEPPEPVT